MIDFPDTRSPYTLRTYLEQYTVDVLKSLAALCDCKKITRKADLIDCITAVLKSPAGLHRLWEQMDDLSRKALSQAVHNGGEFDPNAFLAQYEQLPARPESHRYWRPVAISLDLFLHDGMIPKDVLPLLESWVPRPEPFQLEGWEIAPDEYKMGDHVFDLLRADTEHTGQQDLATLLRLIEAGKWRISTSTHMPHANSVKQLLPLLKEGDFYPLDDAPKVAEIIRPVGLSLFAIGSGLAKSAGRWNDKTELTDAGREWLRTQEPQLLLDAFEQWVQSAGFDELSRIRALRGQKSSGTHLSRPSSRRERIIEALSWCPAGVWIPVEEFFRAILIWQFNFDVETTDMSNLHLGSSKQYGWLEYLSATAYWRVVNGLYILAILWEYLATIGALDILYLDSADALYPAEVPDWGDDLFSLYDGFSCFRINDLGAYLLGQHDEYVPFARTRRPFLKIERDLIVHFAEPEQMSPADGLMLETFAIPLDEGGYRLDLDSLLAALEQNQDLEAALAYLTEWHIGPLPQEVTALFTDVIERSRAFGAPQPALKISARNTRLVQMVMGDPKLKQLCKLAGDRTIVISANRERAFRNRLRALGYVIPK